MFPRCSFGVDIRAQQVLAVALRKQRRKVLWAGHYQAELEDGVMRDDFSEPNVLDSAAFVEQLRRMLKQLPGRTQRIGFVLPDSCGQQLLLSVDTPFNSVREGDEIVRWQLKEQLTLPTDSQELALDYQVLHENEAGQKQILVGIMRTRVLAQYEALFQQAGCPAAIIDFQGSALYDAQHNSIPPGRDHIFVAVTDRQLVLLAVMQGRLSYYRSKSVAIKADQIAYELNRSLVNLRKETNFSHLPVYLHSSWGQEEALDAVAGLFEQPVQPLPEPIAKLVDGQLVTVPTAGSAEFTAACGVAERLLRVRQR